MSLMQRALVRTGRVSPFATRPRTTTVSPRLRQRRLKSDSSSAPEPAVESKAGKIADETVNTSQTNASSSSPTPSAPPTSSSPAPSANTAAASAGAATPPATASTTAKTVARSRGLREIIKAGPLGRTGRWYSRVQEKRPYTTQVCSSIIIYLCGDLSAQIMFPSEAPGPAKVVQNDSTGSKDVGEQEASSGGGYDPWRTVRHLIVGTGSSIPSYNWFWFLHNHFNYPSKFLSILTKVVVQQICFTPIFNTYFFSMHSLLAGATLEETWERLRKALPVSITNSVKLWPAVTAFSFMYVPPQFRNVFSGCIAVGWQTYLSWLNQKAAREVQAAELAAANPPSRALTGGSLVPATESA
ncbi:uncharacterized protein PFLUO_LOCUS5905 [Penicillium psychrofluorescens]|uniref:uncharacterized protein n=1 Tax=Penicillium psychrofluorescens TaxID=3158075 RepID=UPI003CCCE5A8